MRSEIKHISHRRLDAQVLNTARINRRRTFSGFVDSTDVHELGVGAYSTEGVNETTSFTPSVLPVNVPQL